MSEQSSETTNAAIYARVSTDGQAEHGTSLDEQVRRCKAYCESQGWAVTSVYREEGVSGSAASRPQLDRLLQCAHRHELDAIVVAKLDRWGRSMRHLTAALGDLDDLGIRFASVGEAIDSSTPSGRLLRNVLGAIAEFEREAIIERTTSGLRAVARGGSWPGGPAPYGYRIEREGNRSRLTIDDSEATMIRHAIECLVDKQLSTWQTALELNALGLTPRRSPRWTHNNLRTMLLNAVGLSGHWPYRRSRDTDAPSGQEIIVEIPPIISEERHEELNRALRATSRGPGSTARKNSYLLVGRIRSACGGTMQGVSRSDRGTRAYRCANDRPEALDRCDCRRCEADALENTVWDEVVRLLTNPARLNDLARVALDSRPAAEAIETEDLAAVDRRIARLENGLASTIADLVRQGMDATAIRAASHELENDLLRVRERRATVAAWQASAREKAGRMERLLSLSKRAAEALTAPDPELRRRVLDLLDLRVRVKDWVVCDECEGRGFVSSMHSPRTRSRGATGIICPACSRYRFIPMVDIDGVIPDTSGLDEVQPATDAARFPFKIQAG